MKATRQDACAAVLGAVLIADTALDILLEEHIRPEHFYDLRHQAVYRAMLELRDAGQPVDPLTLKAKLPEDMRADVDLAAMPVPVLGNLRGYCQIVRDEHWYDQAGKALTRASDAIHSRDRAGIFAALADLDTGDPSAVTVQDNGGEFVDWYEDDTQGGLAFPFHQVTEAVGAGGAQPGEVTVIGGWSGMGKSILLMNFLLHFARNGARVHEYANEMHGPIRTARVLSALTGINSSRISKKNLSQPELTKVIGAVNQLPYQTTPTAGWRIEDYCREMRKQKWDVCAIDTVTNLPCSRVDEWDRACVMLADAAAQSGTHLIEVCQLNQERDKGTIQPAPKKRDLRNTGAWQQRARNIIFIHRDQEVVAGTEIVEVLPEGHVRVDKATHGDGSAGFVQVCLNPSWLRFEPLGRPPLEVVA